MFDASIDLIEALRKGTAAPFFFVYLDHPDGAVYFWTGVGDEVWDGNTFKGVGQFASIDRLVDTGEIQAHATSFTISGIDADLMKYADANVRNRTAKLWRRWVDEHGNFFDDALLLVEAPMDFSSSNDDGQQGSITITTHSPVSDWRAPSSVAYTNEEQQRQFAGDTGFDRIPALVDKEITGWAAS